MLPPDDDSPAIPNPTEAAEEGPYRFPPIQDEPSEANAVSDFFEDGLDGED